VESDQQRVAHVGPRTVGEDYGDRRFPQRLVWMSNDAAYLLPRSIVESSPLSSHGWPSREAYDRTTGQQRSVDRLPRAGREAWSRTPDLPTRA
jgi:hypothetical protein